MFFTNPAAAGAAPSLVNPATLWQQVLGAFCSNLVTGTPGTVDPPAISPYATPVQFNPWPPPGPTIPNGAVVAIGNNLTAFTAGLEVGALIGAALTGALGHTIAGVATPVPTGAVPPFGGLGPNPTAAAAEGHAVLTSPEAAV